MRKSVKKVLIGGGLAAGTLIAAGAWSYVITRKLVEIALDRKEDETVVESKKHIAGDPETSAFVKVREDAAEKLEGSSHDTVEITAQDGIKLVGHWRFCKKPKRIMIAMHGWRSSWARDFGLIADFFYNNDCHVLYAEQRGQNNSGGVRQFGAEYIAGGNPVW